RQKSSPRELVCHKGDDLTTREERFNTAEPLKESRARPTRLLNKFEWIRVSTFFPSFEEGRPRRSIDDTLPITRRGRAPSASATWRSRKRGQPPLPARCPTSPAAP